METPAGTGEGTQHTPFSVWVIAGGLVYIALALLVIGLPIAIAGGIMAGGGFLLILFAFVPVFLVAAAFSLRQRRWAYVLGAVSTTVLILLFGVNIIESAKNPADSGFWLSWSGVPATILVVLFSILSLRNAKAGLMHKRYLATPQSTGGLLTFAVVGFVVGALVAGVIGAGIVLRNLESTPADIDIVLGAAGSSMAFVPQTFPVDVGDTVTWVNRDQTSHTVTSNDTSRAKGLNSPLLSTGETWTYTFTEAGRYEYHCGPHPMMWGVVIVS